MASGHGASACGARDRSQAAPARERGNFPALLPSLATRLAPSPIEVRDLRLRNTEERQKLFNYRRETSEDTKHPHHCRPSASMAIQVRESLGPRFRIVSDTHLCGELSIPNASSVALRLAAVQASPRSVHEGGDETDGIPLAGGLAPGGVPHACDGRLNVKVAEPGANGLLLEPEYYDEGHGGQGNRRDQRCDGEVRVLQAG